MLIMNKTYINFTFVIFLSVLVQGCGMSASISDLLDQDSSSESPSTPTTESPAVTNPFVVKYNNKLSYTNSVAPFIEITGVADIQNYITADTKVACEASQDWKIYDSNSRIEVTQQNAEQTYFLKVKDINNQIFGCHEMKYIHDNIAPNLAAGVELLTHAGMISMDRTPQIVHSTPTDNLAGVEEVQVKLINYETKADITSWSAFTGSGSDVTLPSPISQGTMYQVVIQIRDKAGNSKQFVNQEAFLGTSKLEIFTELKNCSASGLGVPHFADFDLDGDFDVLQIPYSAVGPGMCFFENQGNLYHTFKPVGSVTINLSSSTVIDLDKDGFDDIVGSNYIGNTLAVQYGKGDFTFDEVVLKSGTNNFFSSVVDLDQDGKLDIIVTLNGVKTMLRQTSRRVFEEVVLTAPVGFGIAQPVNLNNDAKIDFYVGNAAGKVRFLKNAGDNLNFTLEEVTIAVTSETHALPMDYDGDGDVDVFHSRSGSNTQRITLNDGTGAFTSSSTMNLNLSVYQSDIGKVVDLNQDGFDDFISNGTAVVMINNAGSGFTQSLQIEKYFVDDIRKMNFRDINGDQKLDIVYSAQYNLNTSSGFRFFQVFESTTGNNYQLARSNLIQTDWLAHAVAADMKGNGEKQILIKDVSSSSVLMYEKKSLGYVASQYFNISNLSRQVVITDKNNDGVKDFLTFHSGNADPFYFHTHSTNLSFTQTLMNQTGVAIHVVSGNATVGDSYPDLVTGHTSTNRLVIQRNTTGASYSPLTINSGMSYSPQALAINDFNGDTYPDIVVSGSDNNVYLYANNGSNVYTPSTLITGAPASTDIRIIDLDNNGFKDIVMVQMTGPASIQYQTSAGVFNRVEVGPVSPSNTINDPFDMCDFDSDGDQDIVLIYNGDLLLYSNVSGVLSAGQSIAKIKSTARSLQCVNLDSDAAKEFLIVDSEIAYVLHP